MLCCAPPFMLHAQLSVTSANKPLGESMFKSYRTLRRTD